MMTQPEALRLIQHMDDEWPEDWNFEEIRAELLRLHEVNQELLKACETLVGLPGTIDWIATLRLAVEQARAAIAKATGETK